MIPASLAWLGLVASVILVIGLPLQLAGWLQGTITSIIWLPMLAFEVPLAIWLLTRGVVAPNTAFTVTSGISPLHSASE
jgi:hypothetical protein